MKKAARNFARRAPTAAERKRWKANAQKIDIAADRQQIADLKAQLDEAAGLTEVVNRLKTIREQQGVSLRALEASSGIPRGNISKLENHLHRPTLGTLQQYASALGKSLRVVVVDESR